MRIKILGAGAGGGLPQWNCGCQNCNDARKGILPQMTQSSVAISADGTRWIVLNASPDVRAQLTTAVDLWPKTVRDTPIEAVVLTNGDIDHIAGLLTLREKTGFQVCATQDILDILRDNAVFSVLDSDLVVQKAMHLDQTIEIAGLQITPFAVPGKIALYLEEADVDTNAMGEQTIGLEIYDGQRRLCYVPGCASLPDWLVTRLATADMLMFDGTVWENDDMQRSQTGQKTGARMGHLPMTGASGSLARLSNLSGQRLYIHINNTNPVLQPNSPERQTVERAGWIIAQDNADYTL